MQLFPCQSFYFRNVHYLNRYALPCLFPAYFRCWLCCWPFFLRYIVRPNAVIQRGRRYAGRRHQRRASAMRRCLSRRSWPARAGSIR